MDEGVGGDFFFLVRTFLNVIGHAALDALLALNLDMSMDTVAYRMHFWNWDWSGTGRNPFTADWFGIPYGNFVGWITLVFSYSIISRLLERRLLCERRTAIRVWSIPALTTILSLGVLFSSEMFLFPSLNHLGIKSESRLVILTVLLLVVILRGWSKHRPLAEDMPRSRDGFLRGFTSSLCTVFSPSGSIAKTNG